MDASRGPDVRELLARTHDALTVRRVFGEPYEKDGVTVIPAARIRGGAGGGGGGDAEGNGGTGGGFGLSAHPVGALVIRGGEVAWRPTIDVSRAILGCQVVAVVALLAIRSFVKARSRARRAEVRAWSRVLAGGPGPVTVRSGRTTGPRGDPWPVAPPRGQPRVAPEREGHDVPTQPPRRTEPRGAGRADGQA